MILSQDSNCRSGLTYNTTDKLCEVAYSCPTGTAFDSSTDLCVLRIVSTDIKPGDSTNAINLKNDQTVTVAILGSSTFNVKNIVISPLSSSPTFGGNTPHSPIKYSYQDVNKDGKTDLVVQYKVASLGFSPTSTQGCISGTLANTIPIYGCDSVKVVKS